MPSVGHRAQAPKSAQQLKVAGLSSLPLAGESPANGGERGFVRKVSSLFELSLSRRYAPPSPASGRGDNRQQSRLCHLLLPQRDIRRRGQKRSVLNCARN
ncbi:hypothetical protein WQQ_10420 [Hydrocarboniphaga effusa AP103]|uniref:Uncharacterized protein n=1 Tax=Hydrocarboniphaga effusa AP103 TaxID=1172194 RepID=I8TAV2_9GAMM|nr:hypothetical protein WQQ_10420 [Hydrocarboniphaga effusa AP103]